MLPTTAGVSPDQIDQNPKRLRERQHQGAGGQGPGQGAWDLM
jgi:hypothetical protein